MIVVSFVVDMAMKIGSVRSVKTRLALRVDHEVLTRGQSQHVVGRWQAKLQENHVVCTIITDHTVLKHWHSQLLAWIQGHIIGGELDGLWQFYKRWRGVGFLVADYANLELFEELPCFWGVA